MSLASAEEQAAPRRSTTGPSRAHMDTDQTSSSSSLPRGLVTRSGLPVKPGQRIPSLRSTDSRNSSMSPVTSGNSSSNNGLLSGTRGVTATTATSTKTTRGGAVKRTFKPTIPPKDAPKEPQASTSSATSSSSSKKFNDKAKGSSESKRGPRGASARGGHSNSKNNPKDKSKFIQIESSVFTGATGVVPKEKRINGTIDRSTVTVLSNKASQDGQASAPPRRRLESLLCDDFIEYSDSDGEDGKSKSRSRGIKPIGWDNLMHPADETETRKSRIEKGDEDDACGLAGDLIRTRANQGTSGRLILMQLSNDLLSESSDNVLDCISNDIDTNGQVNNNSTSQLGMIGRMRVHKSGKVTFVSTSGSVSEVNMTDEMKPLYVKTEGGNRVKLLGLRDGVNSNTHYTLNQYAVHLDQMNEQMVSLGCIETSEKLIVLPDVTTTTLNGDDT